MKDDVIILAIESSCDETAAAVVKNGREVLSNVISSQIDLHTLYGGVVPEIASRKHIEKINPVIEEAMEKAGIKTSYPTATLLRQNAYGTALCGLEAFREGKSVCEGELLPIYLRGFGN